MSVHQLQPLTYVKPIVSEYLETLEAGLIASGINAELLLMQSNGGLTPVETAAELPMNIIESGPAGGVVGARLLAEKAKLGDLITLIWVALQRKHRWSSEGICSR